MKSGRSTTLPETLAEALGSETSNDYRWSAVIRVVSLSGIVLGSVGVCVCLVMLFSSPESLFKMGLLPLSLISLYTGLVCSDRLHNRKTRQERMLYKLRHHAAAVGPALTLLHSEQEPAVLGLATEVILQHVPQMSEGDYRRLTRRQKRAMANLIDSSNRDLATTTLRSLAKLGDETIIPALLTLERTSQDAENIALATACIDSIVARSRSNRLAKTLLRSTPGGHADHKTLVRASASEDDQKSEELLRSST